MRSDVHVFVYPIKTWLRGALRPRPLWRLLWSAGTARRKFSLTWSSGKDARSLWYWALFSIIIWACIVAADTAFIVGWRLSNVNFLFLSKFLQTFLVDSLRGAWLSCLPLWFLDLNMLKSLNSLLNVLIHVKLIQNKVREFHQLKVEDHVPEACLVILHKFRANHNALSILIDHITEFLQQVCWRQPLYLCPFFPIQTFMLNLSVDLKVRYKLCFAKRTLRDVLIVGLLPASHHFLFSYKIGTCFVLAEDWSVNVDVIKDQRDCLCLFILYVPLRVSDVHVRIGLRRLICLLELPWIVPRIDSDGMKESSHCHLVYFYLALLHIIKQRSSLVR